MAEFEAQPEIPEPKPAVEPEGFRLSLPELIVILGVVFLLAVILIPIAQNHAADMRRLDEVERFQRKSDAPVARPEAKTEAGTETGQAGG